MNVDVVLLPKDLKPGQLAGKSCCVFDVLRATTTMAAALDAGVAEIRLFGDLESAKAAGSQSSGPTFLCGETKCVRPDGFDLGNSPGQFLAPHKNATLFMSTTNGTKALLAAKEAAVVFTAALVNARAVARQLVKAGRDVTLLCAGTNGEVAMEDVLGAGAIIAELSSPNLNSDVARMAFALFQASRDRLLDVLSATQGGQNVISAKLDEDIAFAARLNAIDVVGQASGNPLAVRRIAD